MTDKEWYQYDKERLESDLQLNGYILLGWYQGQLGKIYTNYEFEIKYGWISGLGKVAYFPVTGERRICIWDTYARYAPHPNPIWNNKRWTHFVKFHEKSKRKSIKEMLRLFSEAKPEPDGLQLYTWIPSVPLWLLGSKKDMRSVYLAEKEALTEGRKTV